jgi:hypothetical protein
MLARANLPEVYPDAKTDWESVGGEITSRLGAAGLEAIQNSVEAHLNHYRANLPDLFEPGLTLDPRLRIPLYARTQRALSNPYLSLCDERIRGAFESLYAVLGATGDQQAILKEILREVIPRAGFQAGCIYTVNPERLELVPQTAIGTARRSDYSVQDVSLSHGSGGIVPLAYMSTQPIVEYAIKPNGDCVNLIAVSVGTQRRVGVILLEIEGHRYDLDAKSILSSVKAIQHALSQCLDSASN